MRLLAYESTVTKFTYRLYYCFTGYLRVLLELYRNILDFLRLLEVL